METLAKLLILSLAATIASGSSEEPLDHCNARIVGGYQADISEIPFQVAITLKRGPHCGGSLISNRWVLSAAHCFHENFTGKFQVRINSTYGLAHGKIINVVRPAVIHPEYNPLTSDYDFALLELAEEVELSDEFYAAELPDQDEPIDGEGVCLQTSGWGKTEDGSSSETLLVTYVPLVDWDRCRRSYRKSGVITERMICAGYSAGGVDACQGDSGGPLVDGRKLVGVVSFGAGCGLPGVPGVYAKVSAVRDWISFVSGCDSYSEEGN